MIVGILICRQTVASGHDITSLDTTPTMGEILTESQRFHRAVGFEEANRIVAYVKKL